MQSLIDLASTPLRESWTPDDLEFALRNERLVASMDALVKHPELADAHWSQLIGLIWQRRLTAEEDTWRLMAHPRDVDLTPQAYKNMVDHVFQMLSTGQWKADPAWPQRFPELYSYDPRALPKVRWNDRSGPGN